MTRFETKQLLTNYAGGSSAVEAHQGRIYIEKVLDFLEFIGLKYDEPECPIECVVDKAVNHLTLNCGDTTEPQENKLLDFFSKLDKHLKKLNINNGVFGQDSSKS